MKLIRDNVIFLLVPNMNPDGTTMVASWYRENLGKAWELRPPELWHKYVGHDDNRDWFMMAQTETRNSARQLYDEWFPQIVYNQHQTGPFPSRVFVPPFDDPMNRNIPPLVIRGVNLVGDAMTRRLDQEGKRGAVSRIGFDTWWNGGMRTAPYFHNMIGILTETGHASPAPANYDPKTFPKFFANTAVPTLEPSTYYPSPFLGGEWHLRNSCDYMVTTSMAVLDIGARRRTEWLYDIFQMGRDAIRANANETFIVPAPAQGANASAQLDSPTAVKLVNVLRLAAIEVERATAPFSAGGKRYGVGSFLIRGAQPFEAYARDLLTPQRYPDLRLYPGGPPKRPYDITGWTLSYQMGVAVDRVAEAVDVPTEPVGVAPVPHVTVPARAASAFALDPRENDSFVVVNRLLKAGDAVFRATAPLDTADLRWPAGAFLVTAQSGTAERIGVAARALGVSVAALNQTPSAIVRVRSPRIALYHAWGGNMDEGWTRWLLEQFEFPYTSVYDRDVREGNLRARFDVIVLPDATYDRMLNGQPPGSLPEIYTGGLTTRGIANLIEFAARGGTLVAMDRAAELAVNAPGLSMRNRAAGLSESDFFVPGSLLRIAVDPSDPLAYGMPSEAAAFFINSPVLEVASAAPPQSGGSPQGGRSPQTGASESVRVAARYAERNVLMSGWLLGESVVAGQPAVMEATLGKGRLVLIAIRSQHRGQSHGTFKFLFNAILLGASDSSGKTLSSAK
jgi:hypothetical protein